MRIAVFFDATAARAYARGSVAIGETLAEITDAREDGEQVCAALPAASLLAAVGGAEAVDLYRLANHPAVMIVSTLHSHAVPATRLAVQLAIPGDTAAAALLATLNSALLFTGHAPELRMSKDPGVAETPIDIEDE